MSTRSIRCYTKYRIKSLNIKCKKQRVSLTADILTLMKSSSYIRIHIYIEILLHSKLFISLSDLAIYPICKRLTNYCISYVIKPLSRNFLDVSIFRQIVPDFWILLQLSQQSLYTKFFELWDVESFDVIRFDTENCQFDIMRLTVSFLPL